MGSRDEFEAWMATQNKERLSRGFHAYTGSDASMLMDAWQDGREAAEVELAALKAKAAVPDGHALIPARIELSPEDIACIMLQCGGDEEATEIDEQFNGGVLWVGSLRDDDGSETYGLHIACVGYLEEGSTTIAEFEAAPAQPHSEAKAAVPFAYHKKYMGGTDFMLHEPWCEDGISPEWEPLYASQAQPQSDGVIVPDRMVVPKPLWKDARNPYGDPLNAADIRGAEMFNLAIDEVLRLNSAAAPSQQQSDAVMVPTEAVEVVATVTVSFDEGDEGSAIELCELHTLLDEGVTDLMTVAQHKRILAAQTASAKGGE